MCRCLINRLTSTCVVALMLGACGGRTADIDEDEWANGGTSNGGTSSGGFVGKGGVPPKGGTTSGGSTIYPITGGTYWSGGTTYGIGGWPSGGYTYATGGYIYATGGRATGGYGGYSAAAGKATGGISGYSFIGGAGGRGGVAGGGKGGLAGGGRGPTAGSAGFLRGGAAGYSGYPFPAGASGSAGRGGVAGMAGAAGCPAIACTSTCPVGRWTSLDGCSSCACAPPDKKLTYDTVSCPAESLVVTVGAAQQAGTWVFNFGWVCNAISTTISQPLSAYVGVTILNQPSNPITSTNTTITFNSGSSGVPIVFFDPQINLAASGLPYVSVPLTPANGAYLSIRREGNQFVGGIYLPATTSTPVNVMLAGSFSVAVP